MSEACDYLVWDENMWVCSPRLSDTEAYATDVQAAGHTLATLFNYLPSVPPTRVRVGIGGRLRLRRWLHSRHFPPQAYQWMHQGNYWSSYETALAPRSTYQAIRHWWHGSTTGII